MKAITYKMDLREKFATLVPLTRESVIKIRTQRVTEVTTKMPFVKNLKRPSLRIRSSKH